LRPHHHPQQRGGGDQCAPGMDQRPSPPVGSAPGHLSCPRCPGHLSRP
jgi:hypothetical protein